MRDLASKSLIVDLACATVCGSRIVVCWFCAEDIEWERSEVAN